MDPHGEEYPELQTELQEQALQLWLERDESEDGALHLALHKRPPRSLWQDWTSAPPHAVRVSPTVPHVSETRWVSASSGFGDPATGFTVAATGLCFGVIVIFLDFLVAVNIASRLGLRITVAFACSV